MEPQPNRLRPIIVNDPNDPRLKAYQDSSYSVKYGNLLQKFLMNKPKFPIYADYQNKLRTSLNPNIEPIGWSKKYPINTEGNRNITPTLEAPIYKQPVQEVILNQEGDNRDFQNRRFMDTGNGVPMLLRDKRQLINPIVNQQREPIAINKLQLIETEFAKPEIVPDKIQSQGNGFFTDMPGQPGIRVFISNGRPVYMQDSKGNRSSYNASNNWQLPTIEPSKPQQ